MQTDAGDPGETGAGGAGNRVSPGAEDAGPEAEGDTGVGVEIALAAPDGVSLPETHLRRALGLLLEREGVGSGELAVTFLADAPIRELNRRYLDHDWVPDVLAFELEAPLLGDVYVGIEQARRQAAEHGVPVEEELVRLAVHGTLHLLGYDHPEEAEGRLESEQTRIQEALVREVFG
jgi:probable rRNA maturation factor